MLSPCHVFGRLRLTLPLRRVTGSCDAHLPDATSLLEQKPEKYTVANVLPALLCHALRFDAMRYASVPHSALGSKRPDKPLLAYRVALTHGAFRTDAIRSVAQNKSSIPLLPRKCPRCFELRFPGFLCAALQFHAVLLDRKRPGKFTHRMNNPRCFEMLCTSSRRHSSRRSTLTCDAVGS